MLFRRWLLLLLVYLLFMIGGAVIFLHLERWFEYEERNNLLALKMEVLGMVKELDNSTRVRVVEVLGKVGEECGHDFLTLGEDAPLTWTLWNSFFFTFTVITTIGFGHMAPKTIWGRVACILYSFIGVPLNGILIVSLADIFSSKVELWNVREWASRYKTWFTVLVDTVVFLVPGLVVFLVFPSIVLMYVEDDWTYLDAFYFSFITLTTIGFGDHVAGQQERDHVWVWVYKVVMVAWIIFGLGYIIMLITFVQKALKSKRILKLEKKMGVALKKHVWRVHKDLGSVRRAINNNRVSPEQIEVDEKLDPASPDLQLDFTHRDSRPHTHLTPIKRTRSASESDLSMSYVTHRDEVEGMNVMLDFIERLLHHQETHALTTFNKLMHQYHCPPNHDDDDEEENIENIGGTAGIDVEEGCDNSAFEPDALDMTVKEEAEKVEGFVSKKRKKSNVQELLYLMITNRGEEKAATTTAATTTTTTTTTTTQPASPHSPPPTYNSIAYTPSRHTLNLLSQFLQRHSRGHQTPFLPPTSISRPSSHPSNHPSRHTRPQPPPKTDEFTKL